MDDRELMKRVALGDVDAFTQLLQRHRAKAEHLADGILHDRAQSEDVVQEAFARVWLLRQSYRPEFTFTAWLSVIIRRLCIDTLRRSRHAPLLPGELPEAETGSAESECLRQEERMELWDRLRQLNDRDRGLLEDFALNGLGYRELSARYGMSLALVKVRLHRIRKLLSVKEEEQG